MSKGQWGKVRAEWDFNSIIRPVLTGMEAVPKEVSFSLPRGGQGVGEFYLGAKWSLRGGTVSGGLPKMILSSYNLPCVPGCLQLYPEPWG